MTLNDMISARQLVGAGAPVDNHIRLALGTASMWGRMACCDPALPGSLWARVGVAIGIGGLDTGLLGARTPVEWRWDLNSLDWPITDHNR